MSYDISELLKLPPAEKLAIIGALWDSVDAERALMPDWHKDELDRRDAEDAKNPEPMTLWSELRKSFGLS